MNKRFMLRSELIVLDRETDLAWQRSASFDRMVWKEGFDYVKILNQNQYGGCQDWRYPTQEELATLIVPEENRETGLFISPLFEDQRCCWSSTEGEHHLACYVDFYYGGVYLTEGNYANHFIRAVRNI
jgi:serine/threonine-protein kinase